MVPYSPQHILRLEKRGQFPRRVRVGANRVAWLASEVEAWIAVRIDSRD
jgi:prophage regulatory protein